MYGDPCRYQRPGLTTRPQSFYESFSYGAGPVMGNSSYWVLVIFLHAWVLVYCTVMTAQGIGGTSVLNP
jgi:hypothetical protein